MVTQASAHRGVCLSFFSALTVFCPSSLVPSLLHFVVLPSPGWSSCCAFLFPSAWVSARLLLPLGLTFAIHPCLACVSRRLSRFPVYSFCASGWPCCCPFFPSCLAVARFLGWTSLSCYCSAFALAPFAPAFAFNALLTCLPSHQRVPPSSLLNAPLRSRLP